MGSWNTLPSEIQNLIFSQLKPGDTLRQCQLVCKGWSDEAQRHQYKSIYIHQPDQLVKLLAALCSSAADPGRYVLDLWINCWDDSVVPYIGLLRLLLVQCPNIERLHSYDETKGPVFEEIRKAWKEGSCSRLKDIPAFVGDSENSNTQYYDTVYCLRKNLEDVILDETYVTHSSVTVNSLMQCLNEFQNMRSLTLKAESMETLYKIGEYMESCPALEVLHLEGYRILSTIEDRNSIMPCSHVKELEFDIVPLTEELLEYIINAFPNLNKFTMDVDAEDPTIRPIGISNRTWVKFLAYLHTVREIPKVCPLYITGIPEALTEYFNTMELNNINLHIEYLWASNNDSDNSYVYIVHPTLENRSNKRNPQVTVSFRQDQDEDELAYTRLLRTIGYLLKTLKFSANSDHFKFRLDQILQYCTSLVRLELFSLPYLNNLGSQVNTSIKHVEIYRCNILMEEYPELSTLLPSLSNLCIRSYFQEEPYGNDYRNCHNYIIEMPSTSFDTLTWEAYYARGVVSGYNINLKVITPAKSFYYFIGHPAGIVSESSDITFGKSLFHQGELSIYINCRDIKELQLDLNGCSWVMKFKEE
jgi:hypothetical protein